MFDDLRDPDPPRPDGVARGAVAHRARELRRRRLTRITSATIAGALVVGLGAVGALALSDDDEPATRVLAEQVERTTTTTVAEAPSTTTAPAPVPPPTEAPAPSVPPSTGPPATAPPATQAPATTAPAPQLATLRLSLVLRDDLTLTHLYLEGTGYSRTIPADPSGGFVLTDVPPGDYYIAWMVETPPVPPGNGVDIGTSALAGREPITLVAGDNALQLSIG